MEHITRKSALESGLNYYFTGIPCKYNHIAKRFVVHGTCYDCVLNKNKIYNKKNADKLAEYKAKWYQENKNKSNTIDDEAKKLINKTRNKNYKDRQKERIKAYKRISQYGLTEPEYNSLLDACDNKCTICGNAESSKTNNGLIKALCIDHCHSTGQVRGLLCDNCNRGLGLFKDSIESLKAAVNYLEKFL